MPHLDARALETDPEGMATLRNAIAPDHPAPVAPPTPFAPGPTPMNRLRLKDHVAQAILRLALHRTAAVL
jgi:hypothetical protein